MAHISTDWEDRLADAIYRIEDGRNLTEDSFETAVSGAIEVLRSYMAETGVNVPARVHEQDRMFWENWGKRGKP